MAGVNFSGIASGIDGNAIIQATVDAKNLSKVPYQNKQKINEDETAAYQKLRDLLSVLNDKAGVFQTFRGTAVAKTVVSSDDTTLSAAVSGNANTGTVSIKVNQLASSGRITFDDTFASTEVKVAPSLSGTEQITISVGSGSNKTDYAVDVDSSTTVNELINRLNDISDNHFTASMVNVGTAASPQFKMMISGLETGIEKGTLDISVGAGLQTIGVFDSRQLSQATDAIVDVPGVGLITRGTNVINDIFPGLSVELKQAGPTPVVLRISNDIDKTTQKIADFIAAYNEVKKYVDSNSKISRVKDDTGNKNVYGTLARTRVDDELMSTLKGAYRSVKLEDDSSSEVKILADLGIETNKDTGDLELDEKVLKVSLNNDPQGAGRLLSALGDKLSSSNGGIINEFVKYKGLLGQAETSNEEENDYLATRIDKIETNIQKQKEYLVKLFANLESTIGKMQSGATALTSLIQQNKK